jgi:tRNA-intron lyase
MSVLSLRVELRRRGLSIRGCKAALCARLSADLEQSPTSVVSVPARFPQTALLSALSREKRGRAAQSPYVDEERNMKRIKHDIVGYVMASAVWVTGAENMTALWDVAGGYGKGNLSRSEAVYGRSHSQRGVSKNGRAARQLLLLEKTTGPKTLVDKEDIEHLQLTRVEAFHATFIARRMRLVDGMSGEGLDDELTVWRAFCLDDPYFAHCYAAYTRYKQAGWMPRSGLKYGVDWVLYASGTKRHSHAPYCVMLASNAQPIESSWIRLQNKLRLVKNVAKNLIAARVYLPCDNVHDQLSPKDAVNTVQLTELTIDRWVS